jgi:DNA-directed RNA polymerase subunit RPC12/RpoP
MKRITFATAIAIFLLPSLLTPHTRIGLQEQQLQIRLRRDWGFSSGTGKIQGTFSIRASGPDDLTQVIFYLNDQILGEVNQEPFNLQFVTDNYPVGVHKIHATGTTDSGEELTSNLIQVEFVTAGAGWQSVTNIIIPIGVVILIAAGLAVGVPLIFSSGKKESLPLGAPRSYGFHGGAICPKCSRPFSRHIYGLNLGTHKYDRCPYCGKWSLVRRASKAELEAAEAAELAAGQEGVFQPQTSAEESLRRDLEESRFED